MKKRVLIDCEFSGVVRRAFRALGHDAYSCDLEPAEDGDDLHHFQCDALTVLDGYGWDLMICHPPCTDLAVSGAKHFASKGWERQSDALDFVQALLSADIPRIALENPISIISSIIRKPDQIIQPYWFGHEEFKRTCLWLKNLPPLIATNYIEPPDKKREPERFKQWSKVHREPPGPNRQKNRSRTYTGIAAAMAEQWGAL